MGLLFGAMIGLLAFFTNRWFVNPQVTDTLAPADAIVVFPGGRKADDRIERAIGLAEAGYAPVLFIATDIKQSRLEAATCDGFAHEFETACRMSNPVNTFGNALATAGVAAERGWDSVILVTADDHIARSHMLLRRCYDGEIQTAVSVKTEGRERLRRTAHEWAGMVKALFVDRC